MKRNVYFKDLLNDGQEVDEATPNSNRLDIELTILHDEEGVTEEEKQIHHSDIDFDTIIIDCSLWSFVDSMGVKALITVSVND